MAKWRVRNTLPLNDKILIVKLDDGSLRRVVWSMRINFLVTIGKFKNQISNQWIHADCVVGWRYE